MAALVYVLTFQCIVTTLSRRVGRGALGGQLTSSPDACDKYLVVESEGSPLLGAQKQVSFYHTNWLEKELFVKKEASGCTKTYVAKCEEKAVIVEKVCANAGAAGVDQDKRCLAGFGCVFKGRKTQIAPGDQVTVQVPGAGSIHLTSGLLKFYAVSPHIPQSWRSHAAEVEKVAGWARSILHDSTAGEVQALKIQSSPRKATRYLFKAARMANEAADGVDAEAQTLNHLLMLLFEERKSVLDSFKSNHRIITTLAEDFDTLQGFKGMYADHISKHGFQDIRGSKIGLSALASYYRGLAKASNEGRTRPGKHALIFTCSFGGGHKSAANAVQGFLQSGGFTSNTVDTTYDPEFQDSTTLKAAWLFNDIILKGKRYKLHNTMDTIQQLGGPLQKRCPSPACNSARKHQFRLAVLKNRPDLLITVYHMELLTVLEVAKELGNLAVIHMATDMDLKMAEIFTPKMHPVYPRFLVGVPFNIQKSYDTTPPLDRSHTFLSGYPVRTEFLQPVDKVQLATEKAKLAPAGTRILLVMTGGGGQDVPWPYKLAEEGIGQPLHIIVIAGGNNELAGHLHSKLPGSKKFPDGRTVWQGADKNVTVEVATDPENTRQDKPYFILGRRLAFLMDAADVVLSKPGGGSTAEIAYRGAPVIFDVSSKLFHWEQFTVDIFVEQGRSLGFKSKTSFRPTLLRAMDLGRSTRLAAGPDGAILNTAANLLDSAEEVLGSKCVRCRVFSDDAA